MSYEAVYMEKGLYVMADKIITQDETSTSQNRLLTSKIIVEDLSASYLTLLVSYYDVVIN